MSDDGRCGKCHGFHWGEITHGNAMLGGGNSNIF